MCVMKTDAAFCGNREVKLILERRRAHNECKMGEGGCEVVWGRNCGGGRRSVGKGNKLMSLLSGRMDSFPLGFKMWVAGLVFVSLVANIWFIAKLLLNGVH